MQLDKAIILTARIYSITFNIWVDINVKIIADLKNKY